MALVAEMMPMTRNGCSWKPPPPSLATLEHDHDEHMIFSPFTGTWSSQRDVFLPRGRWQGKSFVIE